MQDNVFSSVKLLVVSTSIREYMQNRVLSLFCLADAVILSPNGCDLRFVDFIERPVTHKSIL